MLKQLNIIHKKIAFAVFSAGSFYLGLQWIDQSLLTALPFFIIGGFVALGFFIKSP